MAPPQTVIGFFDQVDEAQQAVQLLLRNGFTHENIGLSAQAGLKPNANHTNEAPTEEESRTGRFLFSLFGASVAAHDHDKTSLRSGTRVTVSVWSTAEASQATELLGEATEL
ncbi:hypothetical protein [Spirosoma endbachense]|uniref:Uncharacterized protein n=1 Tax=Spirosoma endbachense TaxID=2666025 RepID=A0A6P1W3V7_9BACT|nr:hypothetical protein [Spirosoma endbachense]QHV98687.1 hypothetical protein GJR95_28400 [Spirosoma endbachense]